ncbi:MAG TPA: cytochrome c biogenesis protein ResB [Opitutaceae bacterium]
MREFWSSVVKFFVSLQLTVVLLILSMLLVFVATLDQVNLGIWAVQEKYFRSFIVLWDVNGVPIPVFPGGYFVGGLLLLNLVASHIYRFHFTWKKAGILLTHFGLIVLLVGELLTGLWQEDYQMRLDEGETKNYSESPRFNELAITDVTDPQWDDVVAIPEARLAGGDVIQHAKLPFRVVPKIYFPNSAMAMQGQQAAGMPGSAAPQLATQGIGTQIAVTPLRTTYKQDERNLPAAYVELIGTEGSLGTWLVSPMLMAPQTFSYQGRSFRLAMRFEREYKPFALTLLDFSHDKYPGTEIPKNFSSRVRLASADGRDDREVLIYMNNPLRYAGLTFYQAGFDNNDRTTVLQVVRNPSWLLPYIACGLMTLGLLLQFGIHLSGFFRKRRTVAARTTAVTA